MSSFGSVLDEMATEVVSRWTFRPGMNAGKPVATQAQVLDPAKNKTMESRFETYVFGDRKGPRAVFKKGD